MLHDEFLLTYFFQLFLELIGPAAITISYNVLYQSQDSSLSSIVDLIKYSGDATFSVKLLNSQGLSSLFHCGGILHGKSSVKSLNTVLHFPHIPPVI